MPSITAAIDAGHKITRECLQEMPPAALRQGTRRLPTALGPKRISVARLPVTGSEVFGRDEDIAFLNDAWEKQQVNIATVVAWGGVGKSTLINLWLRRMAAEVIVLRNSFLAGPSTDRARAGARLPPKNLLMRLSTGLEIRIHGSERRGRRAKGWRSLSRAVDCLALTLLGSYLTDAYNGDIRHRKEVSEHLARDVRQGAHARKVMESYQTWFGEGPEVSVLRMLVWC